MRKPYSSKTSPSETKSAQRLVSCLLALALLFVALPGAHSLTRNERAAQVIANDESDAAARHQALLDLTNTWTVMCIAAHPDDEDGATLTLLRRKYGVHTVTIFSTFGEGGQNATGPELYQELGAIRARETEEAAEVQGSEAFFLGLRDFGFSKSAEEAFRIWGRDEALRRMVLKIRQLRPDVIITNHDTVSGHGHHQATGRLVLEAFEAAADPARFPEQLRHHQLDVWQVERVFVRVNYEGGTGSKVLEEQAERAGKIVSYDVNERDPVRGTTYAEQALRALQHHASQGPWPATVPAGPSLIRYRLAREARRANPLPPNSSMFLRGLLLPEKVASGLAPPVDLTTGQMLTDFATERERVLKSLTTARHRGAFKAPLPVEDAPRFRLMNERLDRALALFSGVALMLTPRNSNALVAGEATAFSLSVSNERDTAVQVERAFFNAPERAPVVVDMPSVVPAATTNHVSVCCYRPRAADISVPHTAHLYDDHLGGKQFTASASVRLDGASFIINASTRVDIVPAVEIKQLTPSPLVLTPATAGRPQTFTLKATNHLPTPFEGTLTAGDVLHDGGRYGAAMIIKLAAGEMRDIKITFPVQREITSLPNQLSQPSYDLSFSLSRAESKQPVHGSASQRTLRLITKQSVPVMWSDARVAVNLRVGYVRSFDSTLPNALMALGVEAKELRVADVRASDLLARFDAIIIDNRGYQAHPELIAANQRLLDYTRAGGTLIVFYHKANEWNPDAQRGRPQLAPYPIILGSERVTDENAPVVFSDAQHALLNFPNRITPDDFKNWIQERGLYFPKEWDTAHYSAPLAMSDAGETTLRGGLLAADYGRGRYLYTSMVWYRQLRAGNAGAYRVFANMISYGRAVGKVN